VAEAWRNLTAVGALPIAITDNLNFGNPEKPEIMGQIVRAIDGMAEACRALDFPVVSGNVSLYNETNGAAIPPTPTVGAVGLLKDYTKRVGFNRVKDGDGLILVGQTVGAMGSGLYLREVLGIERGAPPSVDLGVERKNGDFVRGLITSGQVTGCHDLSDGGLLCAAADMALSSNIGVELSNPTALPDYVFAFGEDQARYLLAVAPTKVQAVLDAATKAGVYALSLGQAGGETVGLKGAAVSLNALRASHEGWIPAFMAKKD
jgi:phosphoribosylformylglycinamidine synthase